MAWFERIPCSFPMFYYFFPAAFQRAFFYKLVFYIALCLYSEKDKYFQYVFWSICSHWENVSLMDRAILTSLAAKIRGNLTNRPFYAPKASASWRLVPLGVHLWISQRATAGSRREISVQVCQWKRPSRGSLLLVFYSRLPLSRNSEERWERASQNSTEA